MAKNSDVDPTVALPDVQTLYEPYRPSTLSQEDWSHMLQEDVDFSDIDPVTQWLIEPVVIALAAYSHATEAGDEEVGEALRLVAADLSAEFLVPVINAAENNSRVFKFLDDNRQALNRLFTLPDEKIFVFYKDRNLRAAKREAFRHAENIFTNWHVEKSVPARLAILRSMQK